MGIERPIDIGWFAHQYAGVRVGWEKLIAVVPPTAIVRKSETDRDLRMVTGSRWEMFTCENNAESALGRGFNLIAIDEAARVKKSTFDEVIMPMSVDKAAPIILITSPKGKKGKGRWVYQYVQKARAGEPGIYYINGTTLENPLPSIPEWVEFVRRNVPLEVFEQEIMGTFLDSGAGVLDLTPVAIDGGDEDNPVPLPFEREPNGGTFSMGLDIAQKQTWTVATVLDQSGRMFAADRFQLLKWESAVARAVRLAARYGATIYFDATGVGGPVGEMIEAEAEKNDIEAEGVIFTNDLKSALVSGLQVAIERRELKMPWIAEFIDEAENFEAEVLPSGRVRYGAADGFTDDAVYSLGLAEYGRQTGGGSGLFEFMTKRAAEVRAEQDGKPADEDAAHREATRRGQEESPQPPRRD